MRADAQHNRQHLIEVARQLLTADPGASLNAIAKSAGVGAGTLYRHFPSREALVFAVYQEELDALATAALELLRQHPPLEAFHLWSERLLQFGLGRHGLLDILDAADSADALQRAYAPLLDAITRLMSVCKAVGEVREDADAQDFLLWLGFVWRLPPTLCDTTRAHRLLAMLFRALGARELPAHNSST